MKGASSVSLEVLRGKLDPTTRRHEFQTLCDLRRRSRIWNEAERAARVKRDQEQVAAAAREREKQLAQTPQRPSGPGPVSVVHTPAQQATLDAAAKLRREGFG